MLVTVYHNQGDSHAKVSRPYKSSGGVYHTMYATELLTSLKGGKVVFLYFSCVGSTWELTSRELTSRPLLMSNSVELFLL